MELVNMNKFDIILSIAIFTIGLIIFGLFRLNSNGSYAVVYYEHNEVLRIDLKDKEKRTYTVKGYNGDILIETLDGKVSNGSYPRDHLKRTQTPQAFKVGEICELHREAIEKGITNSVASCTLMIELGKPVYFSSGAEKNVKLTTVEDIDIFKALLAAKRADWIKG